MCISISAGMLTMLSTGLQVFGALAKGSQQQDYYDWQAEQARADARAAREEGDVRAEKIRRLGDRQQSEARAALAAAGVEVGAGTAVRIDQQIERDAEWDARQELLSASRRGARLEAEAGAYEIAGERAVGNSVMASGMALATGWRRSKLAVNSRGED